MRELLDLQKRYEEIASMLAGYQDMSKSELVYGYCRAEDAMNKAEEEDNDIEAYHYDSLRGQHFAAIMLRYWFKIFKWMQDSASLQLEPIEFANWLYDAIDYALKHRAWEDPTKAVYNDPNGPDKVINQCCASERLIVYQYYNKQKRKGTTRAQNLDIIEEEGGDSGTNYANAVTEDNTYDNVDIMIKAFINRKEGLEALIIDGMANFDTAKEIKQSKMITEVDDETGEDVETEIKYTTTQFDPRRLVKHLNTINEEYIKKFFTKYGNVEELYEPTIKKLTKMNNTKLYKYIEKTILEVRATPELLECLTA